MEKKSMAAQSFFFVINGDGPVIGGHKLSALSLATAMRQRGSLAGVLMAPPQVDLADVDLTLFEFYPSPLTSNLFLAVIKRAVDMLKILSFRRYDVLVAADYESVLSAMPSLILTGMPLIQIHANEKISHFPPVMFPGMIVFTDSVYHGYQRIYHVPAEYICVSSGRVNFEYFAKERPPAGQSSIFPGEGKKILAISRLVPKKIPMFVHLMDQLRQIGDREIVQLVIVGDGESRTILEQKAAKTCRYLHSQSTIMFAGGFRVTPSIIRQADLVVGQGRTVIEAIASGVPAASSGEEGYKGLIMPDNFLAFRRTDFSGRLMPGNRTLEKDLSYLPNFLENAFDDLYTLAKEYYDVSVGIQSIEALETTIFRLYPSSMSRRVAYARALTKHIYSRTSYYLKWVIQPDTKI
jgi:hypothetical protein